MAKQPRGSDISTGYEDATALLDGPQDNDQFDDGDQTQDFSAGDEYDEDNADDESSGESSPEDAGGAGTDDSDSGLSSELLDEAKAVYDFSDEDLRAFPTDDALRAALRLADKRLTAHQQQQPPSYQQQQQQPPQFQQQQPQQPDDDEVDLSGLAEDDPTRGVLQKLGERNRTLRGQLDQVVGYIQQQQARDNQRIANRFRSEGLKALEQLDPVLYGKEGTRSAGQMALAEEVINGPYLDFVRSQIAAGKDFEDLNLGQFATSAARSRHFEKLTRRVETKRADAVRKRAERVRTAAGRGGVPRERPEDLHPDRLTENKTLNHRINSIRSRDDED